MLEQEVRKLEKENSRLKEELRLIKGEGVRNRSEICRYCEFYHQHYARTDGGTYHEVGFGHCVNGQRTKGRKPDAKCEYFEYKVSLWK